MAKRDYYEVLGVSRDCAPEDLKKAYRRLAMQYHPDRNPGNTEAEERFKEANEAYSVLSDPQRRSQYDTFGHAGPTGQGFGDFGGFGFGGVEDLLNEFFGVGTLFGMGRERARRGPDLRYNLTVFFQDAVVGAEKEIEVPRQASCGECSGSGAKKGTRPERCSACNGRGERSGFRCSAQLFMLRWESEQRAKFQSERCPVRGYHLFLSINTAWSRGSPGLCFAGRSQCPGNAPCP